MPKTKKIQRMFDGIAPEYDRFNHIASLGVDRSWRKRALKEIVEEEKVQQILDAACGTGDFSIAIARKMNPESHIIGVDLSEGMLSVMREKISKDRLGPLVSCEQGDCSSMRFADSSFDRVTIAFGVRNMEDRQKALKEILRVLKKGGKLVILELSVPSNPLISWFYKIYFTKFTPHLGEMLSSDKDAYRYLPASVLSFPGAKEWMATMSACGYEQVRHRPFTFGICRMYVATKP